MTQNPKAMLYKAWSLAVILAALSTAGILLLESQLQQVVLLPDQELPGIFGKGQIRILLL